MKRPPRQAGFTLVELLLSMLVLTLLTIALFSILNGTATAWSRSENTGDAYREARAALSQISQDLGGLVRSANFDSFFWSEGAPVAPVTISPYQTPDAYGNTLFFYSLTSSKAQEAGKNKSNLVAIGYYLEYTTRSGNSSYRLFRHLLPSNDVNTKLTSGNPTIAATVGNDEVLANNIIDLKFQPWWADNVGGLTKTPPTGAASRTPPRCVDVSFATVSGSSASRLISRESWEGERGNIRFKSTFDSGVLRFATRIYIPGK